MLKWASKSRATALTQRQHSESLSAILGALNQRPLYGAVFPTGRIHGTLINNQGAEAGLAPFTIIPNDTLGGFVLPTPLILSPAGLEVLVPKGSILLPGGTQSFY